MYDNVKKQLQDSFDSAAPDFLSEIMDAEITKIDSEEKLFLYWEEEMMGRSKRKPWRFLSVAAAALLICMLSAFMFEKNYVTTTVTINDGTEVVLYLNQSNHIVKVKTSKDSGVDPDAIKGKKLDEGLRITLQELNHPKNDHQDTIEIRCQGNSHSKDTYKIIRDVSDKYSDDTGNIVNTPDQSAKSYRVNEGNVNNEDIDMDQDKNKELVEIDQETIGNGKEDDFTVKDSVREEKETVKEEDLQEDSFEPTLIIYVEEECHIGDDAPQSEILSRDSEENEEQADDTKEVESQLQEAKDHEDKECIVPSSIVVEEMNELVVED